MQSGDSDTQFAAAAAAGSSAVSWWSGGVHQPEKQQQSAHNPTSDYDENCADGHPQQLQAQNPAMNGIPGEYVQTAYPYADTFFGGMMTAAAAYSGQSLVQPHMLSLQQARMPLPTEIMEEEPVYVNAKQYHGILRRRQSRAKAESENRLVKTRKPYLHESRHLHALRRARGCGGRFLNKKKTSTDSSDGEASKSSAYDLQSDMQSSVCVRDQNHSGKGEGSNGSYHHHHRHHHHVMAYSNGHSRLQQQDQMFHPSSAFHPISGESEGVQTVAAMQ